MDLQTAVSLFSGCGGDTLGMKMAGLRVVAFTEIDPFVQKVHRLNFPESRLIGNGDMTKIPDEDFEAYRDKIDVIFAGFPCQGFSNAGKKKHDDSRNSLFHQFVRSVRLIRPRVIIGENVKGLLSRTNTEKRPYIDLIKEEFDKIGYTIAYRLYSCKKLVPQNRQRLIIVGVRHDDVHYNPRYLLPDVPADLPDLDLSAILKYSSSGEVILEEGDIDLTSIPQSAFIAQEENDINGVVVDPHPYLLLKKNARNSVYPLPNGKRFPHGLLSYGKRISPIHAEVLDRTKPCNTIICTYDNQPRFFVPQVRLDGKKTIRCLDTDELKQIQGFPLDFKLEGTKKQQVFMIGNAAPPPLVRFIVEHIQKVSPHPYASSLREDIFVTICREFTKAMGVITPIKRKAGNTQAMEKGYKEVFIDVLHRMELLYTEAGSQQPIDFTVHHPLNSSSDIPIELKRTSTGKIMCNDTYPKKDIFYIIIHEKKGIRGCRGDELVESVDPAQQEKYVQELEQLRQKYTKNGNVCMYARPNFSLSVSHLFQ